MLRTVDTGLLSPLRNALMRWKEDPSCMEGRGIAFPVFGVLRQQRVLPHRSSCPNAYCKPRNITRTCGCCDYFVAFVLIILYSNTKYFIGLGNMKCVKSS